MSDAVNLGRVNSFHSDIYGHGVFLSVGFWVKKAPMNGAEGWLSTVVSLKTKIGVVILNHEMIAFEIINQWDLKFLSLTITLRYNENKIADEEI